MQPVKGKVEEHPGSLDGKGNGLELEKHIQRGKNEVSYLKRPMS